MQFFFSERLVCRRRPAVAGCWEAREARERQKAEAERRMAEVRAAAKARIDRERALRTAPVTFGRRAQSSAVANESEDDGEEDDDEDRDSTEGMTEGQDDEHAADSRPRFGQRATGGAGLHLDD